VWQSCGSYFYIILAGKGDLGTHISIRMGDVFPCGAGGQKGLRHCDQAGAWAAATATAAEAGGGATQPGLRRAGRGSRGCGGGGRRR